MATRSAAAAHSTATATATTSATTTKERQMTWVCGVSSVYGYGAVYSDVQVKFRSTKTQDLIQKVYPVSACMAAGFAGSVQIGFELIHSLRNFLKTAEDASDPRTISQEWSPLAKSLFDKAEAGERKLGAKILAVAIAPAGPNVLGGAKAYITRFSEPDFRPHTASRAQQVRGIGIGASVKEYKQRLKPMLRITSGIMKGEVMRPGGWAHDFGFVVSRALADHPREGISRHMHFAIVRPDGITMHTNDETIHPPEGPPVEVRMPEVARSYEQFLKMAESFGHAAAEASC